MKPGTLGSELPFHSSCWEDMLVHSNLGWKDWRCALHVLALKAWRAVGKPQETEFPVLGPKLEELFDLSSG